MHLLSAALLALAPSTALAGTFVVAPTPGPGVDYTSIQAAIDAAADGDTILVQGTGFQESLVIQNKGLTLHGFGTTLSHLAGTGTAPVLRVEGLAPGQRVSIEDFTFFRITGEWGPAVVLADNAGGIRFQNTFVDTYDGPALIADACAELLLVDSLFQANAPFKDANGIAHPSDGMTLRDGTVAWAWETGARGSHGFPLFSDPVDLLAGGDAVVVDDAVLRVVNPDFRGGTGNTVDVGGCLQAGAGGAAVRILSTGGGAPLVEAQAGWMQPGSAGLHDPCAPAPGVTMAVEGLAGAFGSLYSGPGRVLLMDGHPDWLNQVAVRVAGAPQDVYAIFGAGQATSPTPLAGFVGPLVIDPAQATLLRVGALSTGSIKDFTVSLNGLPTFTVQLQAAMLAVDGAWTLTNPIALRSF